MGRCAEKFKPKSQVVLKTHATVGDFLDELKARAELNPKTFVSYAVAFRKILSDAFEILAGTRASILRKADGSAG